MLRYATLRYATLRYATLRYATLRYAMLCDAMRGVAAKMRHQSLRAWRLHLGASEHLPTHALLYLNKETFADGEATADFLREARRPY
jgi:hypothetical protein